MITTQRLDNLLSYYLLFWYDMKSNTGGIMESHYSYIIEKYDRFFTNAPDKIKNIQEEVKNNVHIFELAELGLDRWGVKIKDFMNDPDFMKWYFTFYLIHSEKKVVGSHKLFSKMFSIYEKFFTDYDSISDENEICILHELMKQFHSDVKLEYKQLYRTVLIKNLIK